MRGWMIAWAGLGLLGCPKKTDSLEETGDSNPPFSACEDQLVPAPTWFEGESTGELIGAIEWGQTHVIRSEEERWAPPLVAGRAALLLFSPETSLSADSDVRVAAWKDGALVGVLPMASPSQIAPALEQGLTAVPLEPYSDSAWSALLPWTSVQEGVTLTLGAHENGELLTLDHTLTDLGAPHTFTLSRARVVVFGDSDKATDTSPAAQIAQTDKI